jgi:hypothetical protein
LHLPLPHQVHDFILLQGSLRALKGEEAQIRLDEPFNKAMILLDNVISGTSLVAVRNEQETSRYFQFG